jgi:hypothetical protein
MPNELSSEQMLEGYDEICDLEEMGWEMTMQLHHERKHTYWCLDSIDWQIRSINQVCIKLAELRGEIHHDVNEHICEDDKALWGPEDGGCCPCGSTSCDGTCGNNKEVTTTTVPPAERVEEENIFNTCIDNNFNLSEYDDSCCFDFHMDEEQELPF